MEIVCLDLEGVLVPEIWIAFAEETGIPELKRTTRDEPDYDKLMKYRLNILKEHNLGLKEIQETISKIDPLPGAKEFLDKLREMTQVIIISDTFSQFVERSAAQMAEFWSATQSTLEAMLGRCDGSEQARRQLAEDVAELAVQYVQHQLRERHDHLLAEQAFLREALLNPRLRGLAHAHRQILQQGVTHFFDVLGSRQPEQDAVLLTATIMQMEYQGLLDGVENLDSQAMLAILKRYMNLVLGL